MLHTHISESSFNGHTLVTGRLGALERGKELSPKGKGSLLEEVRRGKKPLRREGAGNRLGVKPQGERRLSGSGE